MERRSIDSSTPVGLVVDGQSILLLLVRVLILVLDGLVACQSGRATFLGRRLQGYCKVLSLLSDPYS